MNRRFLLGWVVEGKGREGTLLEHVCGGEGLCVWWWISGLVDYLGIVCVGGVGKAMYFGLEDGGPDRLYQGLN